MNTALTPAKPFFAVKCHLEDVEQAYIIPNCKESHLGLVFTSTKTRQAVEAYFPSCPYPEVYIPGCASKDVNESQSVYWAHSLQNLRIFGLLDSSSDLPSSVRRVLDAIATRVSPDKKPYGLPVHCHIINLFDSE